MKKYQIIYADPPWEYNVGLWDRQKSRAISHYPTMSIEDICKLNVDLLADKYASNTSTVGTTSTLVVHRPWTT